MAHRFEGMAEDERTGESRAGEDYVAADEPGAAAEDELNGATDGGRGSEMQDACDPRLAALRLLHLTSPALPLGGFAYSQGLEWAVEQGWVKDEGDLQDWLSGLMHYSMTQLDVPVFARCYRAWPGDLMQLARWDRFLIAGRETAELRREEVDRGRMLMRCLEGMDDVQAGGGDTRFRKDTANRKRRGMDDVQADDDLAYRPVSFVCAYSFAAWRFGITLCDAAQGYLWSWLENQTAAAIRLIPLGQTAGQRALFRLAEEIPAAVDAGLGLEDDELGASAPALAMASALHETQYTRLFRS